MLERMSSTDTPQVLVTGANGFIGSVLCATLEDAGYSVRRCVRTLTAPDVGVNVVTVGDIGGETDWSAALAGIDTVVHLAARAHILRDDIGDPLREFRRVNTVGTERLARQAAAAGVKRFVYVSSIGVLGENTPPGQPFTEASKPSPTRDYAVSKWEGEQHLQQIQSETGLEVVIVRPPLVYGPHAPGNFARLVKLVKMGIPLPFGSTNNVRSLVGLDNLVSFLSLCIQHPKAAGECFLITDGEDLSTRQLVEQIARHLGRSVLLLPVPESVVRSAARLVRREPMINQLWGSLAVDSSKARTLLAWSPPLTVDEGLRRAAQSYQAE